MEFLNCVVNLEVISREFYFFYYEGKIILTTGFVKKTQKTPKEEIQIAKDRRKDFIERVMKDENI
jgi:phage-related protein